MDQTKNLGFGNRGSYRELPNKNLPNRHVIFSNALLSYEGGLPSRWPQGPGGGGGKRQLGEGELMFKIPRVLPNTHKSVYIPHAFSFHGPFPFQVEFFFFRFGVDASFQQLS